MHDIANIEKIDTRLGYKLMQNDARGFAQEVGVFRFVGGAWKFRTGSLDSWTPVGAPWFLASQLRDWKNAEGCSVSFWRCASCSKDGKHGGREFDNAVKEAGGRISHGYCDDCATTFFVLPKPGAALAA
jgi:hypothetical protein